MNLPDLDTIDVPATEAVPGRRLAPWREAALIRLQELELLADWMAAQMSSVLAMDPSMVTRTLNAIRENLAVAKAEVSGEYGRRLSQLIRGWGGSASERAMAHLDAAETELLRIAPDSYVRGQIPEFLARVRQNLPLGDPRRAGVERISRETELSLSGREALISALRAANSESRRRQARVRSFRNVVMIATLVLFATAAAFAVVGAVNPRVLPVCFTFGGSAACPTRVVAGGLDPLEHAVSGWDVVIIELAGMLAGALAGVRLLRSLTGRSTGGSLVVWLALLKLPTAALTALLGILLMRADFIPGVGRLQRPAEIIAWAAVFGSAQQLLTRAVDDRARRVLASELPSRVGASPEALGEGDIDRAVRTSLQAALVGPTLVNFDGFVSVSLGRAEVVDDRDDRYVVFADAIPILSITIGQTLKAGAVNAPVVVEEGEAAPVVPFVVSVDGERLKRGRVEQPLNVTAGGEARTATFELELRRELGPALIWVRVMQHGRLLQIVSLELETIP
jgi:hypothetical protein